MSVSYVINNNKNARRPTLRLDDAPTAYGLAVRAQPGTKTSTGHESTFAVDDAHDEPVGSRGVIVNTLYDNASPVCRKGKERGRRSERINPFVWHWFFH